MIRNRKDQNGRSQYNGAMVFNTSGTPNTKGYAIADALLSNYQTYSEAQYDPIGRYRYTELGAFVDDSWKVFRKLTINPGFRWEYMASTYSAADNLANFVPSLYYAAKAVKITSTGQVEPINNDANLQGVPGGAPRGLYPSRNTWSPRVGFAYAVDEKTVIRGGFGFYYDRIQGNVTYPALNNPSYVGSAQF